MERLVIAEKNQAAYRIARLLAPGPVGRIAIAKTPVYEFERDSIRNRVVGLRGHILSLDYPQEYNNWSAMPPSALIDVEPQKRREEKGIIAALEELALTADEVVMATDFDREGELIGADALGIVLAKKPGLKVWRARFSALTKPEVEGAFQNLGEPDYKLAKSAETRQYVDLVWGATLTRYISLAAGQGGGEFLSAGRVQTPTLALIVDREEEIERFVPEPFWDITADLRKGPVEGGTPFTAVHTHGTYTKDHRAEAEAAMARTRGILEAHVTGTPAIERKDEYPPPPFNTTQFLTAATSMGLSAPRAMSIAERLYTSGYISYPRTDNTVYPRSLGLRGLLERLLESEFKAEAQELLAQESIRPSRGRAVDPAHPPIHPTGAATREKLKSDDWRLYELVVRRFLATVSPSAIAEHTTVSLAIGPEPFVAKAYRIVDQGWRRYYPYFRVTESTLPALVDGERIPVVEVKLTEGQTRPPPRYGQGQLLQEMERRGLGTKATRHDIIQKLYSRAFVEGRNPQPTPTGRAVIDALEQHARVITEPQMTATLEEDMEAIAEGRREPTAVIKESREMLHQAFELLEKHADEIGTALRAAIREKAVIGPCPQCGKDLLSRRSRRGKRFVGCSGYPACTQSYPLPQRGKLEPMPAKCPHCPAPQVKVINAGRRPWITCLNLECPARMAKLELRAKAAEAAAAKRAAKAAKAAEKAKPARRKPKAGAAADAPPAVPATPATPQPTEPESVIRRKAPARAAAKAAPAGRVPPPAGRPRPVITAKPAAPAKSSKPGKAAKPAKRRAKSAAGSGGRGKRGSAKAH